jgi:hypothetical protein
MKLSEASALTSLLSAAGRKARIGMIAGGRWTTDGWEPEVVHGVAQYIGGQYPAERDFAAESAADVMDLYLIIRVTSPRGEHADIAHALRDLIPQYIAGALVVDYEPPVVTP